MVKSHFIKRSILIILLIIPILFLFISCSSNNISKIADRFLKDFKSKNFEESYTYLVEDDMSKKFSEYIGLFMRSQGNDSDKNVDKLNDVILDRIVNITYDIGSEVKILDDKTKQVEVKIGYYDISDAYDNAVEEFLSRSLDFDNLDNLYNIDTIVNILITHINNLKREEEDIDVSLIKDDGSWKIQMNEQLLDILVGNSVDILENFKSMIVNE